MNALLAQDQLAQCSDSRLHLMGGILNQGPNRATSATKPSPSSLSVEIHEAPFYQPSTSLTIATKMRNSITPCFLAAWAATLACSNGAGLLSQSAAAGPLSAPAIESQKPDTAIWQDGIGEGFRSTVHTVNVEVGVATGMAAFGSRQAHDFALTSVSYGHMWGPVLGEGHWYRGNVEWRAELFGGGQYRPDRDWVIGLTPHLRYDFATGTRWIPFVDGGAGVTATGIGHPDLSGTFEFNLQPGVGMHWFVRDNFALTGEVKYMHMSCAGMNHPNLGLNDVIGLIGVTWLF